MHAALGRKDGCWRGDSPHGGRLHACRAEGSAAQHSTAQWVAPCGFLTTAPAKPHRLRSQATGPTDAAEAGAQLQRGQKAHGASPIAHPPVSMETVRDTRSLNPSTRGSR